MSRQATIDRALTYFDDGSYLDDVSRRVAIPIESQDPCRIPDLYREFSDPHDRGEDGQIAEFRRLDLQLYIPGYSWITVVLDTAFLCRLLAARGQ